MADFSSISKIAFLCSSCRFVSLARCNAFGTNIAVLDQAATWRSSVDPPRHTYTGLLQDDESCPLRVAQRQRVAYKCLNNGFLLLSWPILEYCLSEEAACLIHRNLGPVTDSIECSVQSVRRIRVGQQLRPDMAG